MMNGKEQLTGEEEEQSLTGEEKESLTGEEEKLNGEHQDETEVENELNFHDDLFQNRSRNKVQQTRSQKREGRRRHAAAEREKSCREGQDWTLGLSQEDVYKAGDKSLEDLEKGNNATVSAVDSPNANWRHSGTIGSTQFMLEDCVRTRTFHSPRGPHGEGQDSP